MSTHIISLLVQERDRLNAAIAALQGSASRPTEAPAENSPDRADSTVEPAPKKRKLSAAGRRAIVAATKARWAAIKAAKAAAAPAPVAVTPKVTPTKTKTKTVKKKASSAKSTAFRKKMSERMKAAWAARKKKAAGDAKGKG